MYPLNQSISSPKYALGAPLPMIAARPLNGSITAFDDLILALYPVTAQTIHPPEKWKKAGKYRTAETIYLPDV